MQRLDTLSFALAGAIYGAACVALATIAALMGVPGSGRLQTYSRNSTASTATRFPPWRFGRGLLGLCRRLCAFRHFRLALQYAAGSPARLSLARVTDVSFQAVNRLETELATSLFLGSHC